MESRCRVVDKIDKIQLKYETLKKQLIWDNYKNEQINRVIKFNKLSKLNPLLYFQFHTKWVLLRFLFMSVSNRLINLIHFQKGGNLLLVWLAQGSTSWRAELLWRLLLRAEPLPAQNQNPSGPPPPPGPLLSADPPNHFDCSHQSESWARPCWHTGLHSWQLGL